MIIENRTATAKLKIIYMIMIGMLFVFGLFLVFEDEKAMVYPIAAIVAIYLFFLFRRSDYFYLEFAGNKLTLRFYTAHPIFRQYKTFEIPKAYFFDYQIKSMFGAYIQTIEFTVNTPKGKLKYPPLSISLLNKEQKLKLREVLDELKPK